MKKIFKYASLAVAAFGLAACSVDNVFPKDESGTEPTEAPDIEITISDVKDSSFAVTIAPKDTAAYYSYLVDADEDLTDELDAASLYAVAYQSVAQGTVKYADHKSVSFTIAADPNTTYTVYAVVGSPEGNVGAIAHKTITTSDVVAPFFLTDEDGGYVFESQGTMIALPYSEDVVWDSTKVPTATVYAGAYVEQTDAQFGPFAYFPFVNKTPVAAAQSAQAVVVDNSQHAVIIDFGPMTPGSIFTVNIPEGMLVDYAGNKTAGFASQIEPGYEMYFFDYEAFYSVINSVAVWTDKAPATFTVPTEKRYGVKEQWFEVKPANGVFNIINVKGWKTVIKRTEGNAVTTFTNDMVPVEHFNLTETSVVVYPAGDFISNDEITITIPAKSIMDNFGNVNATEITVGPIVFSELYVEKTAIDFTWFNNVPEDTVELSFYAPAEWTIDTAGIAPFKTTDALSGSEGQHTITITVNDYAVVGYERTLTVSSLGKDVDVTIYKPQNLFAASISPYGYYMSYFEGTWEMAAVDYFSGEEIFNDITISPVEGDPGYYYVYGLFGPEYQGLGMEAQYVSNYGQIAILPGEINDDFLAYACKRGYPNVYSLIFWIGITEEGRLVITIDDDVANGPMLLTPDFYSVVAYVNWHSVGTAPKAAPASVSSVSGKYRWIAPKREVKELGAPIPFKRK